QFVLEQVPVRKRLEFLNTELAKELEVLELRSKIQNQVQEEVGKSQREYFLREQLRAIQRELGEADDTQGEIEELRQKIEAAGMTEEAKKEAERELGRLGRMSPAAAEYTVTRTYLDWLVTLPWSVLTTERIDINKAREVLDRDHYDLEKIKERILEFLAVLELKPQGKAPILCFVGPPGVGKTSLDRSIAGAMGRKFVRISLGGMRDEAEIRGHRRTYIGALPGQIIQNIRRAGSRDPVFMLDEIDKLGADFRGDPASALLEVLDPEQNSSFRDHYLDVAFDLSRIFFITTANVLDTVPSALRDRMETIELPGYTEEEKVQIAKNYLVPRGRDNSGLQPDQIEFEDAALTWVRSYAVELGLDSDFYKETDVHIHVPAGSIPKDGPSAGVTMVTALVSALTNVPIRPKLAMTGEITLSGHVLPVGGIKEKVLAARRAKIAELILPAQNEKNVKEDIQPELLKEIKIHYVKMIEEVLNLAVPKPGLRVVPGQAPVQQAI